MAHAYASSVPGSRLLRQLILALVAGGGSLLLLVELLRGTLRSLPLTPHLGAERAYLVGIGLFGGLAILAALGAYGLSRQCVWAGTVLVVQDLVFITLLIASLLVFGWSWWTIFFLILAGSELIDALQLRARLRQLRTADDVPLRPRAD